jgi:hypothetical protein
MPLPDNFSPAEHLQDVILLTQNKIVRAEFSDVGDDNWTHDISTPRSSLRVACTHLENDSVDMTQIRNWLFYVILRKCQDFHPAIFGTPATSFQETTRYHPQIHLYFEEKYSDADSGYKQLRSQVSLRLMNETTDTLTKPEVLAIATKIKSLFAPSITAPHFHWKRGKELWSYIDQSKGYYFQLLCFNETEAKKIIEQVLDIRSHSPNWKLLNSKINAEPVTNYPTIPATKTILGKPYKQPRRRPVGTVYFTHAVLHIHGKPNPVVLVDPAKRYTESIVR